MTVLCYLDDKHRRYSSGAPQPTVCGREIEGLTRSTIPLDANATRDLTLVSCLDCKAKLVDKALTDPEECDECNGSGNEAMGRDDYHRCGACNGTGKKQFRTVTGRLQSKPNLQNLPRPK